MKKTFFVRLLLVMLITVMGGCASTSNKQSDGGVADKETGNTTKNTTNQSDGGIVGTIPPTSKFAKISIGMPMKEVTDLIGQPTDTKNYQTGKAFIPFYFGRDTARSEALYKGEGRITYTGAGVGGVAFKVYRIVYDPTESGYNK